MKRPLVKPGSGSMTYEPDSVIYEAVNALQQTPWRINETVLAVAQELFSRPDTFNLFPSRFPIPEIERPQKFDSPDQRRQFYYDFYARETEEILRRQGSLKVSTKLSLANSLKGKTLYQPVELDFRGRIYTSSISISNQGDDLSKALIEFDHGEMIQTPQSQQDHMLYGYQLMGGLPKTSTNAERLNHMSVSNSILLEISQDPFSNLDWVHAENPFQFLAWCLDYGRVVRGEASHLPVHIDGCNHGYQIWAMLLKDPKAAQLTNCSANERPVDLYSTLTLSLSTHFTSDYWRREWKSWGVDRDLMKKLALQYGYGGTAIGMQDVIRLWIRERRKAGDPPGWELDLPACQALYKAFCSSIRELAPSMTAGREWLRDVSDFCSRKNAGVSWITPTTGCCVSKYHKHKMKKVSTTIFGRYRSANMREQLDGVDSGKQRNALAANVTHSFDAALLARTITQARREGITSLSVLHDSYGTHANYSRRLHKLIRREAYAIFGSGSHLRGLHDDFKRSIGSDDVPSPPEQGDFDVSEVPQSMYFFQ